MKYTTAIAFTLLLTLFPLSGFADDIIPTRHIKVGKTALYSFEIQNRTGGNHTFSIKETGLGNSFKIQIIMTQSTTGSHDLSISSGERKEFTVAVNSLSRTPIGRYYGEIHIVRDDGVTYSKPFSLTVEKPYALKITGYRNQVDVFSGKEFNFNVTVMNSGTALLHKVHLKMDVPPKWIIISEPQILDHLDPGNNAVIKARVIVPSSQASLIQPVSFHIESRETVSPAGKITVKVQKSPQYLVAALAVLFLAIAATIIFFKKKGRR